VGDREQHIVKTVPRRGYMLAAPVQWLPEAHDVTSGRRTWHQQLLLRAWRPCSAPPR
jgi:DNA-binding winged helix-turn-helix (wHTH) protein